MAISPALRSVSGNVESPYRGLNAFTEHDSVFFFGRNKATDEVLQVISQKSSAPGMVVISGMSSAGKSSLLHAGVLPELRARGIGSFPDSASWPCVIFTPGQKPLQNLAVRVGPLAGADPSSTLDSLRAQPDKGSGRSAGMQCSHGPERTGAGGV
jgi:hypothetical protein